MSANYDFRATPTLRLLRALVETHRAVLELADQQTREYGLTPSEFDCLATLGVGQPMRMCDLARASLLTKSHTTQVTKALEARGLVRRERSPESDREVLAALTPAGQELFERIYPAHYEHLKERFGGRLSAAEQRALTDLLRKLRG